MAKRIFGEILGVPEGEIFPARDSLSAAGVHRPLQAGISGSAAEGADSIVLSGGYEDDEDHGDVIVYTGHGGRHPDTGQQIGDQLLERGNMALAYSCINGLPVRVIRGAQHRAKESPPFGYSYGGLYRVESYWHDTGKAGFIIWRFRLVKIGDESGEVLAPVASPARASVTIQRIVRDTRLGKQIKEMYNHQCQICGIQLVGSSGPYAEAAHIRPLGTPHNGPDSLDNLLCLCPNHHVLFDFGGFTILDNFSLHGCAGTLTRKLEHHINLAHINYRRVHFYNRI